MGRIFILLRRRIWEGSDDSQEIRLILSRLVWEESFDSQLWWEGHLDRNTFWTMMLEYLFSGKHLILELVFGILLFSKV